MGRDEVVEEGKSWGGADRSITSCIHNQLGLFRFYIVGFNILMYRCPIDV